MSSDPEMVGMSIVLAGDFSPPSFSLEILKYNEFISKEEADEADDYFATQECVGFKLPWVSLLVTTNKLQLITQQQPFIRVRDLLSSILAANELMPIRAFGINWYFHFQAKENLNIDWQKFSEDFAIENVRNENLEHTFSLITGRWNIPVQKILQDISPDLEIDDSLKSTIRIEKSNIVDEGIFVAVDNHIPLKEDEIFNTYKVDKKISNFWDSYHKASLQVATAAVM